MGALNGEPGRTGAAQRRPHTGRRRNDAARQAILDAALRLLEAGGGEPVTVDSIAREAGVGKQTIYRWWPSKGAVLLDALTARASDQVPAPDTGALETDLAAFLTATFHGATRTSSRPLLRGLLAEAPRDHHLADLLARFTEIRRAALLAILRRGQERGELAPDADLSLIVDQAYGLFWYRFILGHAPLTPDVARRLAHSLVTG